MRFVAAEAGFFPPGPLTFFADIVGRLNKREQQESRRLLSAARFTSQKKRWKMEDV
jgi:hypothetical protein